MHTLPPDASRILPAAVLAFVLLGGLAAGGWRVLTQVQTAPSTPLPAQALNDTHTAKPTQVRRRLESVQPPQQEDGPGWGTLTTAQKEVLYPLAQRWVFLSDTQKRHWINLAASFKALSPEEQTKMVARITDWASLSAQQRSQARLNYAATSRLPADSKKAQWEAYQALSVEEKKRLAAKAAPKPAGAATALRPVSPKKLAKVPAATAAVSASPANLPKIAPVTDFHVTQALPVVVPAPAVVVETVPIATPLAVPTQLPPMDAAAPAEPQTVDPRIPVHPPQ